MDRTNSTAQMNLPETDERQPDQSGLPSAPDVIAAEDIFIYGNTEETCLQTSGLPEDRRQFGYGRPHDCFHICPHCGKPAICGCDIKRADEETPLIVGGYF